MAQMMAWTNTPIPKIIAPGAIDPIAIERPSANRKSPA